MRPIWQVLENASTSVTIPTASASSVEAVRNDGGGGASGGSVGMGWHRGKALYEAFERRHAAIE